MKKLGLILASPFIFITKYFKACIFLLIVILILSFIYSGKEQGSRANLAKIYLNGPIISSDSIYNQVKKIKENHQIKGALLIINSPGGSVSASVEISDIIKDLNLHIPVVAYVQGTMASGSYYGGMYASKIFANRGALIGSIGVIFSGANIQGLLDKLGIQTQGVAAGAYKEIGTFTRKWTPQEKNYIDALIQEEYQMFIHDVAQARHLDAKKYSQFAEGKIFSAKTAKKLGLIDEVGSLDDAISELLKLSEIQEPIWLEKSKFENYLDQITESSSKAILNTLISSLQ